MSIRIPVLLAQFVVFFLLLFAGRAAAADDLAAQLAALAPDLDAAVIRQALQARDCALAGGAADGAGRLAVIDFGRPSTEPRLWVFELATPALLYVEHVAHGRGSGDNFARAFSNIEGSHQTSLGLFRTAETYQGSNGYSLRLDGLEPGLNDLARRRAIVMHGAPYVDPQQAVRQGRLGRSYGCPAVRSAMAQPIIDTLKDGQLLFAWHPDYGRATPPITCPNAALAGGTTSGQARATQ